MKFIYNLAIQALRLFFRLGAFFQFKLKRGLAGRRQSYVKVREAFTLKDKVIWMHAASLGEYEQGLPVLKKLAQTFSDHKILITFFSPSGYDNVVRRDRLADVVCYLPFDTTREIKDFVSCFNTVLFISVKYEFWYNLLSELAKKSVPVYVISSYFYERQIFFKPYGNWFRKQLKENVSWFFHQNKHSYALARTIGLSQSSIAGDTRFDRVRERASVAVVPDFVSSFATELPVIIFGSSWEAEEEVGEMLLQTKTPCKLIIAPHDLRRVDRIYAKFPNALLFSQAKYLNKDKLERAEVLVVDNIGYLSTLYAGAQIAVVGGGFHSQGLHNILEAAVFGIPTLFGNKYTKNPEADALIKQGGGQSFETTQKLASYIKMLLKDSKKREEISKNAHTFIESQPEATKRIVEHIIARYNNGI
ncbi:3-deoxy-D-manno-octulosonic acid transferase [Planobacterium oryzisoli]|uniref:3-deoxy-D-manno-octulosonic acid transferase n=1 Tax=Planobacterium oryzisoli TaxID=2771435 RepID=A0A930YWN2_9FLAO|nr:glycosyltransferase N-terminal domain-containing protein [Planobacterium oryzisoli]MBF5027706.1 3-deoxy-D-manno-octulosonic acid transferase [Planobacterium oryzisoli]